MSWTEISISVAREATPQAEEALEGVGALAITLQDDEDNPVLEPDPGATPLWPTVHVRGLFVQGVEKHTILAALRDVPGADRPENIRWRNVDEQDWERAWMDRFAPMKFGSRLWIVPGGMSIPHDPANIEIQLDPGLAFGTGTHPTTALCLEWLDGIDVAALTVVDYGCGSGILGIAAALKGARKVVCVDNDPQALEATADNAARNGVDHMLSCHLPDAVGRLQADVVLANILADPLVSLAARLTGFLRPGGQLALSGILEDQAQGVLDAYRGVLEQVSISQQEEWVLLEGRRSATAKNVT
ncbi:50S ribosomal protein L11 methyltransferase [Pseudomonadota bacterium]